MEDDDGMTQHNQPVADYEGELNEGGTDVGDLRDLLKSQPLHSGTGENICLQTFDILTIHFCFLTQICNRVGRVGIYYTNDALRNFTSPHL